MRLNKFVSSCGFCSRRKAEKFIKEGKIKVNGKVIYEPWFMVKKDDTVTVDGVPLNVPRKVYLLFNKPKGVTTTLRDKFAHRKVPDFIPKDIGRVYPVGRLDKQSRGLIILTNDGQLSYKLTHPKFQIEKEYLVLVRGEVRSSILEKLKQGVNDEGEILRVKKAFIDRIVKGRTKLRVVVCEGKKRHIRRLFKILGFPVLDLERIRIGNLKLGGLKEGEFKVMALKRFYKLIGNETLMF